MLKTEDNPEGVDKSVFDGMLEGVRKDRLAFSKWIAWSASPLATTQCIVAFGETDFRADLARFDVPTLVAHGFAATHPEQLNAIMLAFLKS